MIRYYETDSIIPIGGIPVHGWIHGLVEIFIITLPVQMLALILIAFFKK